MRVRVHPADNWGCGHFRIIWPARVLQGLGYDVTIASTDSGSGIGGRLVDGNLTELMIGEDADADVYVFQRTTARLLVQMIFLLRERGKTVVIDMDDDLSCIHPKNAAFNMLHPKLSPEGNWLHVQEACRHASMVTLSTPQLAPRYAAHGRYRTLWNYVPASYLHVQRPTRERRVWGWAGALHSHPDDVPILRGATDQLKDHAFHMVGNQEGMARILGLRADPPGPGVVPLDVWPQAIADEFDVGAAPLSDSRFNRSKSWLKPLEYSALGIPWVASDSIEYRRLHEQINGGRIARSDRGRDWTRHVRELLTDDTVYEEESQRLRAAASEMTIERHAEDWWEAWSNAYEMDHGTAPVARSRTATAVT